MPSTWSSADKTIQKEIINLEEYSKTPTECSTVEVTIGKISLNEVSVNDLRENFNSDILDGSDTKELIIGEASAEIDRQIERAIQMMMIQETSLVTVFVPTDTSDQKACVKFEITLNKLDLHKQIWEWSVEEKYEIALKYKEIGVKLYKESRYVDAFHKFSRACKILITLEPISDLELQKDLEERIKNLRLILYNNMAGCQLSRKNYEHTITLCTKVLNTDENNVKALYRRGLAHGNLKDVDNATFDLKRVLTLEPQNTAAKEHYLMYNAKVQEANQRSVDMVKRMFKV